LISQGAGESQDQAQNVDCQDYRGVSLHFGCHSSHRFEDAGGGREKGADGVDAGLADKKPGNDEGRAEKQERWDRLTGEPLIYASMGTAQNGLESVFNTMAQDVGERAGLQLVLSIGPVLDTQQIKSLPASAIVVNRAPQIELLKRSVLCITHAGLNTTLEALTQGGPLVSIPVTNDQPGVDAGIAYTKTSAFVPLKELTVSRLALLIDEVLRNPEYRDNTNRLRQVIARTNGLEKAFDLLEEALGLASVELHLTVDYCRLLQLIRRLEASPLA
jgi:hypothetical protein